MNFIILKHKISEVIIALIFLTAYAGWIINIIKLMKIDFEQGTIIVFQGNTLALFRFLGVIFPPLGSLLGIFWA